MTIQTLPIKKASNSKAVKALYKRVFPKEEQMPWLLLRFLTACGVTEINCYYHEDTLLGFTYSTTTSQLQFILFFAVEDTQRGKGCGSAILEHLKQENENRPMVLNVEPIDPKADNAQQRLRRMEFYRKNGFYETGYEVDEVGGTFWILSTHKTLDVAAYLGAFAKLSFGLWKPAIRRVKENG